MNVAFPAEILSCRPAAWYYRTALWRAERLEEAVRVGLMAVDEMETLKEQLRELGYIPDRRYDPRTLVPDEDKAQLRLELEA